MGHVYTLKSDDNLFKIGRTLVFRWYRGPTVRGFNALGTARS
jgi:hypothetical protein